MQKKVARRSNRERTETTRAELIRAARRLFTEGSYAATSTPEIADTAGVTRGALYHHFADKQALFRAVVEEEARELAAEIEQASPDSLSARAALIAGTDAYLNAMRVPGRTRLLLLDGPAVLGPAEMEAIDAQHAGRTLREGLAAAAAEGSMVQAPLEALAGVLVAAFDRAAIATDGGARVEDYRRALTALIEGVVGDPPAAKTAVSRAPRRKR